MCINQKWRKITLLCDKGMVARTEKPRGGLCILYVFLFLYYEKLRVWRKRSREDRFKPKIYLRRRRRRNTQWQKNDNHTKIPNTKNQKYGEKSFIQRTCKYRSYPGPGLYYCYCYSHILPLRTPCYQPISSHVSLICVFMLFFLIDNFVKDCYWSWADVWMCVVICRTYMYCCISTNPCV